eukprot:gene2657-3425_t
MAAAAAHAAELEGDGWSPESAALGGRLQMALDARSPGEWHLERAYSRLIKATAIKVVAAEIRRKLSKDHQSALGREAAAMQRTRSQHVCACLGVGFSSDRALGWLMTELVEGQTLAAALEAAGGRLPEDRAVRIAVNVLRGLEAVHAQSLVHRDVKPGNIMVQGDSEALFKSKSKRWSSAAAMRRELQRSLLLGNTDTFHVFLSYRVRTEAWFVELLYEALRKRRVEAGQGTHTQ